MKPASLPLAGKRVVGYGAGLAAVTTVRTSSLRCEFFVDRSTALHGQSLDGAPIYPPERLQQELAGGSRDDFFVIVFAYENRAVAAIFEHLASLGLAHGQHFTDASFLHYTTMAARLASSVGVTGDPDLFAQVRALSITSSLSNNSGIAGSWLMQQLLRHQLARGQGDFAEAGVYKGGNAFLMLALVAPHMHERRYHLLDSFAGFPELSTHDPTSRSGEFKDVSLASIRTLFSNFDCARLHVGFFTQTLPGLADRQFGLAYLDCDLYEPTLECCEFFYPRMAAGGMLLFHDYWHATTGLPPGMREPFTGVARAADEFAAAKGETVVTFPETTHALVVKGRSA
jgi:hypothetical protein